MACISPLYGIRIKGNPKDTIKVVSKRDYENGTFDRLLNDKYTDIIKLPCGNCIGCRIDYARTWSNRLYFESLDYPDDRKWFLTLTYNNDNIVDNKSDKHDNVYSLKKRDLTLFIKRLREHFREDCVKHGFKVRYYACGEYGDKTQRPHFHIILFGIKFQDLIFLKNSTLNFPYYTSLVLSELWDKGFSIVCNASWQTFNYVSRYVMKKHKGKDASYYANLGVEPEFCTMSRMPGIGYNYFKEHYKEIYETDEVFISDVNKGGFNARPP